MIKLALALALGVVGCRQPVEKTESLLVRSGIVQAEGPVCAQSPVTKEMKPWIRQPDPERETEAELRRVGGMAIGERATTWTLVSYKDGLWINLYQQINDPKRSNLTKVEITRTDAKCFKVAWSRPLERLPILDAVSHEWTTMPLVPVVLAIERPAVEAKSK